MSILKVEHLKKVYTTRFGSQQVQALRDVNFSVEEGEFIAIMGESGSGKTTLLNILAALDKPTEGHVFLGNRELSAVSEKEISAFRRDHLGFVFQDFNLLDTFTLRDNILSAAGAGGQELPGDASSGCSRWPRSSGITTTCCTNIPMRSPADRSSGRPWPAP